ncbi:BTB and MATH domain-containing protein 36-like [Stylophora pistillata]|uniref:BTB and MATH domain-containing protein 36-like n=1 Tax=Stylophora pistillata TaxID=50429 RepID=UPI000C053EEC|nr:BTB and MATH domain-containing protein 36-like [Stylophora pistillata]
MAAAINDKTVDFTQPWRFTDLVLVVEEQRFHVHRVVLALSSPMFEKMFTSEFAEKEMQEIPLPGKRANEFKELLKCIYNFVIGQKYRMQVVIETCENFLVSKIETKPDDEVLEELLFAQKYGLNKLEKASIERAKLNALVWKS